MSDHSIGLELENCAAAKILTEVTTTHIERISAVEKKVDEIKNDIQEALVILHTIKTGARFMHRSFYTLGNILFFSGKVAAAITAVLGLGFLISHFRNPS